MHFSQEREAMKRMNQRKLLIEQIESVNMQLKNKHQQYLVHRDKVKNVIADPRLLFAASVFVLFIGFKIYKGQWSKGFKTLIRYGVFFVSSTLKKQILLFW